MLIKSFLVFNSLMCSVNCPSVDIVIPRYLHLSVFCIFTAFTVSFIYSSSLPVLTIIYFVFFRPKLIYFFFCIFAQLFILFLMCSALPAVAILSINTGIPIFILPYVHLISLILLTVDVSAQHMMGQNIVPCFTTSPTRI